MKKKCIIEIHSSAVANPSTNLSPSMNLEFNHRPEIGKFKIYSKYYKKYLVASVFFYQGKPNIRDIFKVVITNY